MFIPGWLISIITFPGVIVHEIAHRFFCDVAKVPVYDICYFRFGNPAGYVSHGEVNGIKKSFLISIGPLIVNSLLCMLLTMPLVFPMFILGAKTTSPVFGILAWIGFSIGMHAFPSNHDMNNFTHEVKTSKQKGILYLIALPFALIIKIANILSVVWFDLIYAVGISFILPMILLG